MLTESAEIRQIRYEELKIRLKEKGYPESIIDNGIDKAEKLEDKDLTNKKVKQQGLMAVSTHNPNNTNMDNLIKNSIKMLSTSNKMDTLMNEKKIIYAKRQPKNLKQLLTTAAFSSTDNTYSVQKCGKSCETCKLLDVGPDIKITSTNKTFTVKHNMNCETQNLIYIITCNGCKKQYVGETGNELKTRMTLHRQHIRHPECRKLGVSKHIAECGRGGFTVFPFYKMDKEITSHRRNKETYFINIMKPELNALPI